ncbi:hypothetical protein F5884DRAFT_858896 [Xylogone sp. PMI_703]|nr:hypothetical protein F5884DRAFT_858896 [Xylogone sp. PMI_703]
MYPFIKSSRKQSYHPVSGGSDNESTSDFVHAQNQIVLKLCRQIRFLAICCILLLLLLMISALGYIFQPAKTQSMLEHLHPENLLLAPEFPFVTKFFKDPGIIAEITPEIEQSWEADMPKGRGFVNVKTAHSDTEETYVVSVFHQLHCLYMIQQSFTKAIQDPSQVPVGEVYHTYHCTELLRRAIKCAADPTLDDTITIPQSPIGRGTSGWNGTHVCRDYDRLFAWAEEHRANDRIGAGILAGHHDEHTHEDYGASE